MNHYTIELQSRTSNLAKAIINLVRSINNNRLNQNIVSQILRSSTSIGANYTEALECESRDDFVHKLSICKKESNETIYWLDLLCTTNPEKANEIATISHEAEELLRIFAATIATTKRNKVAK